MKKIFLIIFLILICGIIFAQVKKTMVQSGTDIVEKLKSTQEITDNLKAKLMAAKEDTNKVNLLNSLSFIYKDINFDEGIKYGEEGINLANKLNWQLGVAKCYNSLGSNYFNYSDYPKAMECFNNSLKIFEKLGNKSGIAMSLGNIGNIYLNQDDYPKALEGFNNSLKLFEELGDKNGMAMNLGNIGLVSFYQSNNSKALEYLQKSLKINEELNNKSGLASNYENIGLVYSNKNEIPKALEYLFKSLKIYEEIGEKTGIASNLGNIGYVYYQQSDYTNALEYFKKAIKLNEELGSKSGLASNYSNIGSILNEQSNFPKALEYYHKALNINEDLDNKSQISTNLENIANIHNEQSDLSAALEYYQKSLAIDEELDNKSGIASNLMKIGDIYYSQSEYSKAMEYYKKSLAINEELGSKSGIALNLGNIGLIHIKQHEYTKASEYYDKSIKIQEEIGDKSGIARNYSNSGDLYFALSQDSLIDTSITKNELLLKNEMNLKKAISNYQNAIDIYRNNGDIKSLSEALKNLSNAYLQNGEYKKAYDTFNEYKSLQDKIFLSERQKEISILEEIRKNEIKDKDSEIQAKENELLKQLSHNQNLELEKKNKEVALLSANQKLQKLAIEKRNSELAILQKDKELAELVVKSKESEAKNKTKEIELLQSKEQRQKIEIEQASFQKYVLIAGLLVFALIIIFIFIRFREKKKLSEELQFQKSIVEEKNEQIFASITYASTIQNALLPWESILRVAFKDLFIFYKPKDIVSGDSYWFQEVNGIKFLAAIDCTGHGVPGAMLTVISSSVLDDAVLSKRLTDTGEILTYMNSKVTEVLNQRLKENQTRDGMEVVLIAVKGKIIQFSGAGRPLYLKSNTLEIIKTDKRGIAGQTDNDVYQFSSIEIPKTNNMSVYLTSDGFADQMNETSKKYSTKRFIALLDSISDKSSQEQNDILESEFNNHKGERSQIDDVTVLGIKI
ncbi:MAG: tetratricopeptide repeat protein [Candidatus Kapabacteria bacterium]|nr:tetratricopeptide repeat protein [Candidatus Kapabacteria bacterium]